MRLPGSTRLTDIIAGVTVIAWLASLLISTELIVVQGAFIPARGIGWQQGFWLPAWLTPLTATLLHGGLLHLALNMVMLVYCGRAAEKVLGWGPVLLLYLVGAYAAAAGQWAVGPASATPMIGASGAISAVIAVYALLFSQNEVKALGPVPAHWVRAIWLGAAWTGVQWLISVATAGGPYAIATAAHVGGFLAGLILARPLLLWRYRKA